MTRVLVTGAGGFIGSNLTRNLVKTEDQINILVREKSNLWRINDILSDCNVHTADLSDFAKNAYDTNNSAITLFHNNDVPGDIGIGKYSKQQIHVRTCWDNSCPAQTSSSTKDVDQCIIDVE